MSGIHKSGRLANPDHQFGEAWPVLFAHCRKLQCQSTTRLYSPYYPVGSDLPFFDEKLQFNGRTQAF